MAAGRLYEFGPFRLDSAERQLFRAGEMVPLTPKAIDTLAYLVERHEHTVGKEELIQKIWPETFVEDSSLTQIIWMLRKALGDSPDSHEYIATLPKRGYRFVASVHEVAQAPAAATAEVPLRASLTETAAPAVPAARPWRRRFAWMAPVAVVVLSVTAYFIWHHFSPRPTLASRRIMLAVLPVQNLTGDPEREYISDGLTEEMIAQLGNLNPSRLGVIARTSSMAYKKTSKTVDKIAHELGVSYVLETSLRESGGRFRVTTQLIRPIEQSHIWAHDYDGPIGDVLSLQNEVAQAVAQEIRVSLAPEEQARRAAAIRVNPQAYDAYLKGRFFWNQRTPEAMNTAAKYFQQAIKTDPNYAPGYVGIADCDELMVYFGQLSPSDGFARARAAAQKALDLDSRLAEAHTTLASIRGDFDWDWSGAEAEYKRALELDPNYATAHHWYAEFLAGMGRLQEATAEIKRAQETDPLSPVIGTTLAQMYCRAGQCDKAVGLYKKVLEMYPAYPQAVDLLAEAYARMGLYEQSVAQIQNSAQRPALVGGYADFLLAYASAMSGRRQEALKLADRIKRESDPQHVDYSLAIIYAALGDRDQAFERLEGALRSHDFWLVLLQTDYRLDSLRSDARYKDLLHRMNLPPG